MSQTRRLPLSTNFFLTLIQVELAIQRQLFLIAAPSAKWTHLVANFVHVLSGQWTKEEFKRFDRLIAKLGGNPDVDYLNGKSAPTYWQMWLVVAELFYSNPIYGLLALQLMLRGSAIIVLALFASSLMTVASTVMVLVLSFANAHKNRTHTFAEVMEDRDDAVFVWELLMWLCTRGQNLSQAIGDFREEYVDRKSTHGEASAVAWCKRQVIREAIHRLWSAFSLCFHLRSAYEVVSHLLRNRFRL